MFFGQSEAVDFKSYIKDEWVNIAQFYEKLLEEGDLLLKGYGFMENEVVGQFTEHWGYYLVKINDRVFAFGGESLNGTKVENGEPLTFKRIIEFNESILGSSLFESSQYTGNKNTYTKFAADLLVEAKIYLYKEEERILLSKKGQGNIELYCSYLVKTENDELVCKVYPAVFTAAKHLAMSKILEQRIKDMKK